MVASTLRNALARRNHKERAQPAHRARLGLLEKHKDYVHRARDYKSKQDRLKKLREKAAFRNKDEFYHGMIKHQTKNGVELGDRGNEALGVDVVRILKSQDEGWVRMQIAKDEKKVSRLRAEFELISPSTNPHTSPDADEDWSAASELAEVEKLASLGVILKPRALPTKRNKLKAALANPSGRVVFAEDRTAFEGYGAGQTNAEAGPSRPRRSAESARLLEGDERVHGEDAEGEEMEVDLGWEDTPAEAKRKMKLQREKERLDEEVEVDEEEQAEELRQRRLDLLTDLSAHLARIRQLHLALSKLAATKGLMSKGAVVKTRSTHMVDDESQREDRNGERKRMVHREFMWKGERRR